jgi:hypothetical protein
MTKIRGDRMQMLGGKSDGASEPKRGEATSAPRKAKLDDFVDDVPF